MIHLYTEPNFKEALLFEGLTEKVRNNCELRPFNFKGDCVKNIYKLPDGNIIRVWDDSIPYVFHANGQKKIAFPTSGIVQAKLEALLKYSVSNVIFTDLLMIGGYLSNIPPFIIDRTSVRLPLVSRNEIVFSCHATYEPAFPFNEAGWAWTLRQGIPEGKYSIGQTLDSPEIIPFYGGRYLEEGEYFKLIPKNLGEYLRAKAAALFMQNRIVALKKGWDRPFQVIKFGLYFNKPAILKSLSASKKKDSIYSIAKAEQVCARAGFTSFGLNFCVDLMLQEPIKGIRLIGSFGTHLDGIYRPLKETREAIELSGTGRYKEALQLLSMRYTGDFSGDLAGDLWGFLGSF